MQKDLTLLYQIKGDIDKAKALREEDFAIQRPDTEQKKRNNIYFKTEVGYELHTRTD